MNDMKILITGFDPFGGETVNPAYEAVKLLPDTIAGAQIIKMEIPTVFSQCGPAVEAGIREHHPDVVLNIGQAGGRSCVTVERVAVNLAEAGIPDNAGEQPMDQPLQPDGPAAYFATIPVKAVVQNVRDHGLPCHLSYSAGTYVCNCVMYNVSGPPGGVPPRPLRGLPDGGQTKRHAQRISGVYRQGVGVRRGGGCRQPGGGPGGHGNHPLIRISTPLRVFLRRGVCAFGGLYYFHNRNPCMSR